MRAVGVRKLRELPELMELPKPAPGPGELLVQVGAAGVNPFDWKILDGLYEGQRPHVFPMVAGVDGAGIVETVGPGVTRFAVGDGVFGQFLHAPVGRGTYAEFATVPENIAVAPVPREMSSPQAAAIPTAGMTALDILDQLGLSKGQTLLIQGAAGGIGSFATQLASHAGIVVLATARGPQRDFLSQLGAHRFFDAAVPSWSDDLRGSYPEGVDALVDLYHPAPELSKLLPLVRIGGQVASTVGAAVPSSLAARSLRGHNIDLQPRAELLGRLGQEFSAGRLRVPLEQNLPLTEGPRVLAESRAGSLRGKTVLIP